MSLKVFSDAKLAVLNLINENQKPVEEVTDPVEGVSTTAIQLMDAIHAALDSITIKAYKPSVLDVVAAATSAVIPDDFLEILGVYGVKKAVFFPRVEFGVGQAMSGNAWFLNPVDTITFTAAIGEDGAKVYYAGLWEKPSAEADLLECPAYAINAVLLYAASYIMIAKASGSGEIRQFNTRVDSGNPEDLPHLIIARALLARFEDAMMRIPSMQKGSF